MTTEPEKKESPILFIVFLLVVAVVIVILPNDFQIIRKDASTILAIFVIASAYLAIRKKSVEKETAP